MDLIFYKSGNSQQELFFMLKLLLIKGLKNNLTFNVFFQAIEEYQAFSSALWNAANILPHGLTEDGYYNLQPIILSMQSEYTKAMHKDIAIVIEQDIIHEFDWKKVFFINCANEILQKYSKQDNCQSWEYINNKWEKL